MSGQRGVTETDLNIFAIRSFRDVADGDYIAARMACRAGLQIQFHWASQQAIEKYLKCILLLNRVHARSVRHSLSAALKLIEESGCVQLGLTERASEFIAHIDKIGRFRYLEVSTFVNWERIRDLDQTIWEVRRFCTLSPAERLETLKDGKPAPRIKLAGGFLERILEKRSHRARGPLIWQNAYFGRARTKIRIWTGWESINAPLGVQPELLDRVNQYVFLPNEVIKAYEAHRRKLRAEARGKSSDQRARS